MVHDQSAIKVCEGSMKFGNSKLKQCISLYIQKQG